MLTKIVIDGKILKEPEKRFTANNTAIVEFVAIHDEKLSLDIKAFGKLAETASEQLTAGSYVLIEGNLETVKVNDKTKLVINAKGINDLGITPVFTDV